MRIFLNAGHGGLDPGAVAVDGSTEKAHALDIALRLGKVLTAWGDKINYSRTTDEGEELGEITTEANNSDADLFVSLHLNAAADTSAHGEEVWVYYDASPVATEVATKINQELALLGLVNRGVKRSGYYVLKYTDMPAILVEFGFMSNPEEEHKFDDPAFRQRCAEATARGIFAGTGRVPPKGSEIVADTDSIGGVGAFKIHTNSVPGDQLVGFAITPDGKFWEFAIKQGIQVKVVRVPRK